MKTAVVVSKFGGTSMGTVEAMVQSAKVSLQQGAKLVVVSATSGTTNDLIQLGTSSEKGDTGAISSLVDKIRTRHEAMLEAWEFSNDEKEALQSLFKEMETLARGIFYLRECSPRAMDAMQSIGERISSLLFTGCLRHVMKVQGVRGEAELFDVRRVLKTDDHFGKAKPLTSAIAERAAEFLPLRKDNKIFVTQGFIGQTEEGMTTTLGRGGSDYSAAILAEAVKADSLEIWTDVAGISTTDPRLVKDAKAIPEISFKEASELATFGAKILHPATLIPAMRLNIPVYVANTFDPEAGGTWIRREVKSAPLVRAMALRKNQVLVTISTPEMLNTHGFLLKIFEIFNQYAISVDAITTSEISVAMTLDAATLANKKFVNDLSALGEVQIEEHLSLVSVIGNNINHTEGLGSRLFTALKDINVRMICQGASKHNVCFIIDEDKGPQVIQHLHAEFVQ